MSGLPREILKWMQSLDLSYSVKNVKRDFANGFLIAEILSRYYKSEITMHSFDNGIGLMKRLQNWQLLERFFRKVGFPIERSRIDEVIHCKSGAAIPLMEQLYTLLTHKTIQASRPVPETTVVPPFARPTASQLIKERMHEADLANTHQVIDASIAPSKAAQVLASHMQKLKSERETDPTRFQPKSSPSKKVASSGANAAPAPIQFKEVHVRQVDDRTGVMQLRASHVYHQPLSSSALASLGSTNTAAAAAAPSLSHSPAPATGSSYAAASSAMSVPPVLSTLSHALVSLVTGSLLEAQILQSGSEKEPSVAYAEIAASLPDDQNASLFHALSSSTLGALVAACQSNPKEFWMLAGWFLQLLTRLSVDSQSFYQVLHAFSSIGVSLVASDAYVASQLFQDFAFARWLALLQEQPQKIFLAAKIVFTFLPADQPAEHIKALEAIKTHLHANGSSTETSTRVFYSILAALAPYENHLLVMNNSALLQVYLRYVTEGVRTSNTARSRAVALSILAPLSANPAYGEGVLRPILDLLRPLLPPLSDDDDAAAQEEKEADDAPTTQRSRGTGRGLANNEWLVDAELLHVLACVLNHEWVQATPTVARDIHAWIAALLTTEAAYPTIAAGLAHLVHALGQQPPLRRVWLKALLEREDIRRRIFTPDQPPVAEAEVSDDTSVPLSVEPSAPALDTSTDLISLFCPPLRSVWHPLTVAQTLADQVRILHLDNLTAGHIALLDACTEDAFGGVSSDGSANGRGASVTPFVDSETGDWIRLFLALRDHLVVELCDPALCAAVIAILRRFLFDPRTSTTAQSIFLPNEQAAVVAASADGTSSAAPPPLYAIMRFMYPDAGEEAQLNLAGFLEELAMVPAFCELVHRNLAVFAENEPEKFTDSPLQPILDKLEEQAAQAQQQRRHQ